MEQVHGTLVMTTLGTSLSFDVDNSRSPYTDNAKNNISKKSFKKVLKKFSLNFRIANSKLCLSLHYNGDNSCLFVNGKEIFKF